jgi:hypothetical protein
LDKAKLNKNTIDASRESSVLVVECQEAGMLRGANIRSRISTHITACRVFVFGYMIARIMNSSRTIRWLFALYHGSTTPGHNFDWTLPSEAVGVALTSLVSLLLENLLFFDDRRRLL